MSMKPKLRLNFNERSDFVSPLEENNPFTSSLWQYPEREPLEQKIADNFKLSPSQVLCTNGGDEAIMILMRLIKETGKMILPLPAFSQYNWGIESWQLDAEIIPGNEDLSINVDQVITTIRDQPLGSGTDSDSPLGSGTGDLVTIITRPNNPSGEMISLEALTLIIETAAEKNAWVFLDEAYIEFSDEPSVAKTLLTKFDNLVVLRTLSKAYGLAGIRLGYILGSEKLITEFKKRCAPFNVAQPTIEIATMALENENKADVKNYCQTIIDNRNNLSEWLLAKNINVLPSQANFLVLQLPQYQARAVQSFLERNEVLVRTFNDEMVNCLRITIPYRLENLKAILEQALTPALVCFDMDGVLIDTSGSYDATVIATVEQLSSNKVTQTEIEDLRATGGYNNDWVVSQKLLALRGITIDLSTVTDVFQKLYLGENNDGLVNNEKVIINESMKALIDSSKSTFSIVTGRPLTEAKAGQQLTGLTKLDVISLDCVKDAKPSPEGIKQLQNKYSKHSWMVGDNPDDMKAAVASNSLAIGIRKTNKDVLYQAGADIVLDDINELENWLCPIS